MEQKFELGPLQKAWIQSLREHSERQAVKQLGYGSKNDYKACCLGELLMCATEMGLTQLKFTEGRGSLVDITGGDDLSNAHQNYLSSTTVERVGLHGPEGPIIDGILQGTTNLAQANDMGVSWSEIANFVEANPEKVFFKSV